MTGRRIYRAAAYLRLSREDGSARGDAFCGYGAESESIAAQRELLCAYIARREDMELFSVYADDGRSGSDFSRPAFRDMMRALEAGLADCVVVKDLSRFGRDYIETGRLIQRVFPAMGVRFVAVNDGFDSLTADYNEASLVLPVKNFVNDSYCRDISRKVRSHQRIKRERGEFIGAFPVYGYRRDGKDRNRLVPDGCAALTVRRIFSWRLEGMSLLAISDRLNSQGVLSPMEYKKSKGEKFRTGFCTGSIARWSAAAVKRILSNEIYTGTMVQGRREKISYKSRICAEKPREDWARVENTHRAIVSREDFDNAERLMSAGVSRESRKGPDIFSGLLFCGSCGGAMVRRRNKCRDGERIFFICGRYNRGLGCGRHSIRRDELERAVYGGLMLQTELFAGAYAMPEATGLSGLSERPELPAQETPPEGDAGRGTGKAVRLADKAVSPAAGQEAAELLEEFERLRAGQERYEELQRGLYEDWKGGMLTKEEFLDFKSIYQERYAGIEEILARQEAAFRELLCREPPGQSPLKLNRELLLAFVQRILVYEDRRLCLELRCTDPAAALAARAEEYSGEDGMR